jgi:hypothetical protein
LRWFWSLPLPLTIRCLCWLLSDAQAKKLALEKHSPSAVLIERLLASLDKNKDGEVNPFACRDSICLSGWSSRLVFLCGVSRCCAWPVVRG